MKKNAKKKTTKSDASATCTELAEVRSATPVRIKNFLPPTILPTKLRGLPSVCH